VCKLAVCSREEDASDSEGHPAEKANHEGINGRSGWLAAESGRAEISDQVYGYLITWRCLHSVSNEELWK